MRSITGYLGIFVLFVAVGAGVSLGLRTAFRSGGDPDAGSAEHRHGEASSMPGAADPEAARPGVAGPASGFLIDLGNEVCPVMGHEVDGKTYTEWNGLRVGHCCPGCRERLLAEPEKLLDGLDLVLDWREAAAFAARVDAASGEERAKLVELARERYEVVRE